MVYSFHHITFFSASLPIIFFDLFLFFLAFHVFCNTQQQQPILLVSFFAVWIIDNVFRFPSFARVADWWNKVIDKHDYEFIASLEWFSIETIVLWQIRIEKGALLTTIYVILRASFSYLWVMEISNLIKVSVIAFRYHKLSKVSLSVWNYCVCFFIIKNKMKLIAFARLHLRKY